MDHRTAPLALRERCVFSAAELPAVLHDLCAAHLAEAALLGTCNRTEFYAVAADPAAAAQAVAAVLARRADTDPASIRTHLYVHVGADDVLRHLCRVAAGLESLVLGETQVLAQVKDAYQRSAEAGTVAKLLHGLFHQALFCAKRVHAETALAAAPISVGAAAVELARETLGDLQGRSAVLLGAGETAEIVARRLREAGFGHIDVVNRTPERAAGLAAAVGGAGWSAADIAFLLPAADVLITSTAAPGRLVGPELVGPRSERPLLVVDIAVPRDVDPAVGALPGVRLCNIDDLQALADAGRGDRATEAEAAAAIVETEVRRFDAWVGTLAVAPLLQALSERMERVAGEQADRTLRRLPGLDARQQDLVRQMARSIVHKVLDQPLRRARDLGVAPGDGERIRLLSELFGLELPVMVGLPGEGRGA